MVVKMNSKIERLMIVDQDKFQEYMEGQIKKNEANDVGVPTLDIDALVLEVDDELIEEGCQPFQRPLNACSKIADRIGIGFSIGQKEDSFVEAVHKVYRKLYRSSDLYMPPMHIGTFAFRDIFLPLRVLIVYGQAAVNPMQGMKDVPENILKWVFHKDETGYTLYDQWADLYDFVYAIDDARKIKNQPEQAIELWLLAKQQLEGAAATLLGSIDKYTVIQNSIIAMELLLKGALFANGLSEAEVKRYGHKMVDLVDKACEIMPEADHARLKMVVARTPKLVERRYQMKDYKRTELGQIMMDAQYLAGEVLRQFSDRNMRADMEGLSDQGKNYSQRFYPPLD